MCGIGGVLSLGAPIRKSDIADASSMADVLVHRGPDARGEYSDSQVALVATRLKIIDLSDDANLPISNEDGSVWMTYNGEVTNFEEIKRDHGLAERHDFKTSSDSEVLVHLYEELGIDFVNQLSGMFAFCLVDTRKGKAWIVRDFYGIRPLFTMVAGDRLYFASELKAFLDLPRFDGALNHEAFWDFFSLAYIPDVQTPWEQIHELQGGCLLEVDLGTRRVEERMYYEVAYDTDEELGEDEARDQMRDLMVDAVRRNMISDAPLGLTLSGGFDTSSMLGILKSLGKSRDVHTYSIRVDEPSYDESYWQHLMARFSESRHHEIVVSPDNVMETFTRHMAYMDEPSGDGAAIPTWLLAEHAANDVSVLLSGEGGDEVFNAYETHMAWKVRKLYRRLLPKPLRSVVRGIAGRLPANYEKLSLDFLAKRFTEGVELNTPDAHFFWRHSMNEDEKRRLMPSLAHSEPTEHWFSDLFHSSEGKIPDELNRISLIDIKYFFIGDLMVKNDRMMMAHSVEARFPWMDRLLVEYASRVPSSMRMKGFTRRYLQKEAMKDFVPREIYARGNMGLEMPHSLWFLEGMTSWVDDVFAKKNVERSGFLEHAAVERMLGEHRAGVKDHGRSLWCLVNFLSWFNMFVYDGDYKKHLSLHPRLPSTRG